MELILLLMLLLLLINNVNCFNSYYKQCYNRNTRNAYIVNNLMKMQGEVEDSSISNSIVPNSNVVNRIKNSSKILYKFSRPHTIKGTILASFMGVVRALIENPGKISLKLIPRAVIGLLALLCGNAYIVGINQIYDVQIDEINKPFLPIAAKQLSKENAWLLVISCLITGVSIVKTQFSPQIFKLYMIGVVLGTIYSVPPFQFKRFPILAGTTIACVRGFLLNFGVFYAVREALSIPFTWNPVVTFLASFMTVFATVIAVTKDLPDIEGDKKYNIDTFAAKYGVAAIANGATVALSLAYITAISLPFLLPGSFNRIPMIVGHLSMLLYFLWSRSKLNPTSMTSIKGFYKAIWNMFYIEYCIYPFI